MPASLGSVVSDEAVGLRGGGLTTNIFRFHFSLMLLNVNTSD